MTLEELVVSCIVAASRYTFETRIVDGKLHYAVIPGFKRPEAYTAFCKLEYEAQNKWHWTR